MLGRAVCFAIYISRGEILSLKPLFHFILHEPLDEADSLTVFREI